MKRIKNVLICGLGAIGGYYASQIAEQDNIQLKILVDKDRLERYKTMPRIINGKKCSFDYTLPNEENFGADLIIIATKSSGLTDAIKNINNFVKNDTIILSFLNGITSEKEICDVYGDKVLYSFLLGHTFFRKGEEISHDGRANIIFGSKTENDERTEVLRNFFEHINVGYRVSDDIISELWQKFAFNCCVNQLSGITGLTFGQIKNSKKCLELIKNICGEISQIAEKECVSGYNKLHEHTLQSLDIMLPEGKTSMLQDIEAKIKPETDIFGKTVMSLGEKHNIPTPYNTILTELIECKTAEF